MTAMFVTATGTDIGKTFVTCGMITELRARGRAVDAAFGKAHLRDALVKVQEGESSHTAEMNGGCAGLQFGAGIFVHPKLVADSDRTVSGRAAPVTFSAGLQGNRTVNIADTRDARWGIFFFVGLRLRSRNAQKTGQTEHQT